MIRLRSGTVGVRFTILYAVVFLVSGIGLLGLTFLLSGGSMSNVAPAGNPPGQGGFTAAQQRIRELEDQLAEVHTQQARQLLAGSLVALIVMAVVSLLLGRVLAKRVLRPLRLITSATRRISADSLDRRLAVTGPADEVKDLADTIDELLERLEVSFAAQRRFVANASHELRTPLTTMRASLDVAVAKPDPAASTVGLADRLRTQLDRVDHLLDGFLVLARAQHGALADAAPVDLGELTDQALREMSAEVETKGLSVMVDVPPGMATHGSPALLARLVGNIVDNAVTHNESGGWIGITGSVSEQETVLVVETGGRVLDQREVDRLTRPFERLGRERTGSSGLGLSIVAAVAAAHSGRLALLARPEGGLRVSITLPVAKVPVAA
ncbi:HAMP domain-containing sensor histidine kinase [Micromonospora sp. ATCC 39149]|uniref:histidine kinase n=1 Tax=Micromonospora carbonacea TaxID=47853 RepID=A0A7D5Y7T7_9ACTN|nr:HAMP domain-containing sensor histidine kinase [Micromonospora sp. ATCC 39149]QLJ96840.1 HAMP domain-containing histidine kinase [Micromonospora carbonacea]